MSLGVFWHDTALNYATHMEVKQSSVDHPEFIPTYTTVKMISWGFDNIVADFYWLSAIQYIGSNAIGSEYKKYLYVMLELVTDLNPHFTFPYQIGELLLPSYNERYEHLSEAEIKKNTDQGMAIGLKWIKNTCDADKVERIRKEFNLSKLWTEEGYKNPCHDSMIPYYLGYISYWNLHDGAKSSEFYRIASANTDAMTGARTMAAIMQGKSGDREKAIIMLLSLAESIEWSKQSLCREVSGQIGTVLLDAFNKKIQLNGAFLSKVDTMRKEIVGKLEEQWLDPSSGQNVDNFCSTYLNKAVREMNLAYLEQADVRYLADKKEHAMTPKELFQNKYIDYIPHDFQKQDEKTGIIYEYDRETGHWDYNMGNLN